MRSFAGRRFVALRRLSVAALVALVFGAGVAGWATLAMQGRSEPEDGLGTVALGVPQADLRKWRAVLEHIDARRGAAFAELDPDRLREVYVADSPLLRADEARLTELRRDRSRVSGLRHDFALLSMYRPRPGEATLWVRERLREHAIVPEPDSSEERPPASTVASSGQRNMRFELVEVAEDSWRIERITPV